ncbi:MAG: tetratricopeptide repeat protein [Clostridia bacterium]|nr:tetratricopeptide repeat protein [Clostridia bacterium]
MQLFGIDLWRILLCAVLIFLVVRRANLVAIFGKIKFSKGDNDGALKIFNIANKIGNLNTANLMLYGYILLRSGKPDEAEVQFRRLLPMTKRESPERHKLQNMLALTYWKQGHLDEAIEELEEAVNAGYKTTQIYQNLGILYNLSDDHEKALKFNLEGYDYNDDDNIIMDNLADAYAINGDLEKSAEVYEKLIKRDPEPRFPEAYYGYGRVLIKLGQREKGIDMIEKSLTKSFSYMSIKTRDEVEKMLEEYKKQ